MKIEHEVYTHRRFTQSRDKRVRFAMLKSAFEKRAKAVKGVEALTKEILGARKEKLLLLQ